MLTISFSRIREEISIMEQLQHPNIVMFVDTIPQDNRIHYLMQYCPGGDLLQYLRSRKGIQESETRMLFTQLLSAVGYIHESGTQLLHYSVPESNVNND